MKIIFLFPGYGTQFVGMSKEIYDSSRSVQELFEQASSCLDTNFVKLCFASSDSDLALMKNAYPALFLVSSSICSLLKEAGISPDAVAGYGPGEYAALHAAKSLNLPDGLYLLSKLSAFYSLKLGNLLLKATRVQKLSSREIQKIVDDFPADQIFISHFESETVHIVSGMAEVVTAFEKRVRSAKGKVKAVSLAHGMHSDLAADVLASFKPYMAKVDIKDLNAPLVSNLDGRAVSKSSAVKDRIFKSIVSPVKWPSVMKQLDQYDMIVEIGPESPYMQGLKEALPDKHVISVSKPEDIEHVKEIYQQLRKESQAVVPQIA